MATWDDFKTLSVTLASDDISNYNENKVSSYTTTNSYVTQKTYKVAGQSIVTIIPKETGESNSASFIVQGTADSILGVTDPDDVDWVDMPETERTGVSSSDVPFDNRITLFVREQGLTGIKIRAKSTTTDQAATVDILTRVH